MSYVFMAMGYGLVVLVMAIAIVTLRKEARRMQKLMASLQEQKELLQVFTEGVETEDQWKILRLLKCDMAQGYCFCKALPPRDVEKFLEQ